MVNTTSQGEQFPPQGTGTIGTSSIHASTEIPSTQAIPTSGSMALNNSTTMPIMSSVADVSASSIPGPFSTIVGTQPTPTTPRPPGFENFRPWREYPYGMPSTSMAGLQNNTSIYTQPHNTVVSPIQNSGSGMNHVGRNTQSQGVSTLLPTLTTNNQAAFRQQMDASNHDMVGVLAREMNTIFSPLIQNVNRTSNDNAQTYQQLSTQMGRIVDFLGAPQSSVRRKPNQVIIQEEEPTINQVSTT